MAINTLVRGTVQANEARTVSASQFADEDPQKAELLMPAGYNLDPAGLDVILLAVNDSASRRVAFVFDPNAPEPVAGANQILSPDYALSVTVSDDGVTIEAGGLPVTINGQDVTVNATTATVNASDIALNGNVAVNGGNFTWNGSRVAVQGDPTSDGATIL